MRRVHAAVAGSALAPVRVSALRSPERQRASWVCRNWARVADSSAVGGRQKMRTKASWIFVEVAPGCWLMRMAMA